MSVGGTRQPPRPEEGRAHRAIQNGRVGCAQHFDVDPLLAVIGHQPCRTQRLVQRAFSKSAQRDVFQFSRQRQAAALDRNGMTVIGIGTHTIDGDEGCILDTESCRQVGILDDLEP